MSPDLTDEAVSLARELIRVDTSNPPGNETPAAELLHDYLAAAGAECELAGPDPERLNLIARVRGAGDGPSLMLMAHTDVVPAPDANWTVPPFEGVVRDDHVIGRGAADMKGELAARAVALAQLARGEERPLGDVVLVAEADEERNISDVGMSWLVRERPDVRCDYAVNEGGGSLLELASGERVVTIGIGEKQVTSARLRFPGRAAHASVPRGGDNPLRHAAVAVERLLDAEAETVVVPAVADALRALGAPGEGAGAVEWAATQHSSLAGLFPAMTQLTVTPTGMHTHEPSNVIPPYADVVCDCRALPGQTEEDIRAHVERALGPDLRWELELLEPLEGGTLSGTDNPLYEACETYVGERLGAKLLPLLNTGFTDSHWVRRAFGTVAYGFAPVFAMDQARYEAGAHGADESLAIADLAEMTRFNLFAAEHLHP